MIAIELPPEGWQAKLPFHYLDSNSQSDCTSSPFYNFHLIRKYHPPVIIQTNVAKHEKLLHIVKFEKNNGVDLREKNGSVLVKVTNLDPSLTFTTNSDLQVGHSHREIANIEVHSKVNNKLQLYYLTKNNLTYSEDKSIFIPINVGKNSINLNLAPDVIRENIRLDFPDIISSEYTVSFYNLK